MRQEAIDNKHFHVVEVLNQWGAKVSSQGEGAVCDAAGSGNMDQVRQMLKSGADPSRGDYDQRTPLHVAAANGHHKMVEFLLHKGANCNATDRWGNTPLYDAVMNGSSGIVATIVQKGGEFFLKLRDQTHQSRSCSRQIAFDCFDGCGCAYTKYHVHIHAHRHSAGPNQVFANMRCCSGWQRLQIENAHGLWIDA